MIDNQPVLTIHRGHLRPAPALVEAFRGAATSHLTDAMGGRGSLDWRIKPMDPNNARFVGPALTAHAYPADIQAWIGAAIEAQAGDVIMCTNEAYTGTAVIGDLAAGMMHNKGIAAFVTDGLARDRAGIAAAGMPLFAMGINPNSPASSGPGQVGAPIMLGGVLVTSGDIIVGDEDGVVVIPLAQAETVLQHLRAVQAAEESALAQVQSGATSFPSWHEIHGRAKIVDA